MAKKLKTDEFDLDSDLDFNFDEEMSSDPFQQSSEKGGKRGVVLDIGKGITQGALNTATDPSFINSTLKKVLPRTYGEITEGVGHLATTTYELYDHTVRELKPKVGQIARKIDQFVPEGQKTLKKITGKMMDFSGESRDNFSSRQDSQEEQAVTAMLGGIFEQNKQYTQMADKKQYMRDTIDLRRHNQNVGVLGAIQQNTSVLSQYTTNVTQAYQRKMLELQLRSYMMNKEHYSNVIRFSQENKALLEAIMKNTGLPEYQKITMAERLMDDQKKKFARSLFGDKSPLNRITDGIIETAKQFIDGISGSLEMVNFGLDGALQAKEMNDSMAGMGMSISKGEMLGEMAGNQAVNWAADKLVDPLRKHFGKDKQLTEKLSKIARVFIAPAAAMRNFQDSENWQKKLSESQNGPLGWFYRIADAVMDNSMDARQGKTFKTGADVNELNSVKQTFDKKAHVSITEIIPGHLAAIHRELKIFRTGDENTPLNLWNYAKGKFETEKEIGDQIVETLKKDVSDSNLDRRASESVSLLVPNANLTPEMELELKIFFTRLSRLPNFEYLPKNIRETKAYDVLSPNTQLIVDSYLKEIEISEDKETKITNLQRSSQGIREATITMEERLQGYIDQGYGDLITKRGLINKDSFGTPLSEQGIVERDKEGKIKRDDIAHARFLEENAFKKLEDSDINVKEAIKEMKPQELLKTIQERFKGSKSGVMGLLGQKDQSFVGPMPKNNWLNKADKAWNGIKQTKLFDWKYKKETGHDTDPKLGPMAQEVNKNLGEEAAPGGKKLDLVSMNGAAMAAVKHLGDKVTAFIKSKGASDGTTEDGKKEPSVKTQEMTHLRSIDKNISSILKLNQQALKNTTANAVNSPKANGSDSVQTSDGKDYGGLTGNVISSIANLGIKMSQDVFGAVGKTFSFAKDNIAKPTSEYLEKNLKDENSPLRKGFSSLFDAGLKMGKTVIDSGTYVLGEFIPKNLKKLKDFTNNILREVGEQINEARDLYLPGGIEPVIRAAKLSSGFYIEAETGKPILNMEQLLKVKGDIVDSAGNIILTAKEQAAGLYDRAGKRVKTIALNIASLAIGAGAFVGKKLFDAASTIKEKGLEAFSGLGNWSKDKWKNLDMSSPFGLGFDSKIMKESNQILIDIRDILLGKTKDVRKRLKDKAKETGPLENIGKTTILNASTEETAGGGGVSDAQSSSGASSTKLNLSNLNPFDKRNQDRVKELMTKGKDKLDAFKESAPGKRLATSSNRLKNFFSKGKKQQTPEGEQMLEGFGVLPETKLAGNKIIEGFGSIPAKQGVLEKGLSSAKGIRTTALGKVTALGKTGGWLGALGGMASALTTGGDKEPTETTKAEKPEPLSRLKKAAKQIIPASSRAKDDKDGDGVKDGSVEEAKNKQAANKAARSKDFQQADLTRRYGGGDGLGMLFGMVKNLFGLATKGLGGLFSMAGGLISKIPGFGKLIKGVGSLLPSAGTVAKTAFQAGRFAVGTAARAAAWSVMTAAPAILSGVASVAGTALGVVGSIIGSPVVLGAVAIGLAGYGLYKLYKRSQRNNASELEKLRLRQYGFAFNDVVMQENYRIYTLESYLQDGRVGYDGGKAYLIEKNIKAEELLELFSIDKEDKEHAEKFALWFKDRFKPIFLTHLTALAAANSKLKLENVNDLKPREAVKYLQGATFESGPYNIDYSPVKSIDSLSTDKDAILQSAKALMDKFTEDMKKGAKESKLPPRVLKAEDKTKTSDAAQKLTEEEKKRSEQERKTTEQQMQSQKTGQLPIGKQAEGDGADSKNTDKTSDNQRSNEINKSVSASADIPLAPGAPTSGNAGSQFIKLANNNVQLNGVKPNLLRYFLGMAEEYGGKTGKTIQVNDGFRSYEEQKRLHERDPGKAAPPGRSLHEFGLAMDINSSDANQLEQLGLMKKYGFTRPVGGEPWHIEPAGVQKNIDIARRDPGTAEKMIDASLTRGGGGYGTLPNATKYKRNTELAVSLLDLPGKDVKDTGDKTKETGMMLAGGKPQGTILPQGTGFTKTASNDTSMRNNVVSLNQDQNKSKSKTLPTPNELMLKASYVSEGEKKPVESEGNKSASGPDGLKEVVAKNAKRAGMDPNIMLATAAVESDFKPNAKAPNSSAMGMFQFMPETWNEMLGKHGSKYGLPANASPFDPEASTLMAAEMFKAGFKTISPVKPDPNATDAYLTHFLGANGAKNFLSSSGSSLGAELMPKAAKQNQNIFFNKSGTALSVKDIYDNLGKKIDEKSDRYGIEAPVGSFKSIENALSNSSSNISASGPVASSKQSSNMGSGLPSQSSSSMKDTGASSVIAGQPKTGLHVDTRGSSMPSTGGKTSSEQSSTITMAGMESRLDKSIGIQQDTVAVLKDILENVKTEKVAESLAQVLAKAMKSIAANKEPSLKEKDDINMGRRIQTQNSSLDFSRRAS